MNTKEKIEVKNYVLYSPQSRILRYIRNGKDTGGLIGPVAERTFISLLDTDEEIRLRP